MCLRRGVCDAVPDVNEGSSILPNREYNPYENCVIATRTRALLRSPTCVFTPLFFVKFMITGKNSCKVVNPFLSHLHTGGTFLAESPIT